MLVALLAIFGVGHGSPCVTSLWAGPQDAHDGDSANNNLDADNTDGGASDDGESTSEPADNADDEAPPADQDLDEALIEGLDGDLFEGLEDPSPSDGKQDGLDQLDKDLLKDLDAPQEDEDENPLSQIGSRMRKAGHRIETGDAGEVTQSLQEEIVGQLDELIKQARQKSSSSSSKSRQSQSEQESQRQDAKQPQAGEGSGNPGQPQSQPARESTDRLGKADPNAVDRKELNSLIAKNLWGHLPQRMREQMLQASMDEFLPKYSGLIEEYFKQLVKQRNDR
jgi:hypothetical protein